MTSTFDPFELSQLPPEVTDLMRHDVLQVLAYKLWKSRCEHAGCEVHGQDQCDWYTAQYELSKLFGEIDILQLIEVVETLSRLEPCVCLKEVAEAAYFKSLDRRRRGEIERPSDAVKDWCDAMNEAHSRELARLYLEHLANVTAQYRERETISA